MPSQGTHNVVRRAWKATRGLQCLQLQYYITCIHFLHCAMFFCRWRIWDGAVSINNTKQMSKGAPFITTSPSASIFLFIAYPSFFSNFRCFLALICFLGPLVGRRPGRAPLFASAFSIRVEEREAAFWATFRALLAWARSRFFDLKFGFATLTISKAMKS